MVRNTYIEGMQYNLPHPFRAEAERLKSSFDTDTYKEDGVIRWKTNGNVPPQEVLDFWKFVGKRFNMQKSMTARKKETEAVLKRYRETQRPHSPEQLVEMRAAFGEGTTVVNVLTGKRTKL